MDAWIKVQTSVYTIVINVLNITNYMSSKNNIDKKHASKFR